MDPPTDKNDKAKKNIRPSKSATAAIFASEFIPPPPPPIPQDYLDPDDQPLQRRTTTKSTRSTKSTKSVRSLFRTLSRGKDAAQAPNRRGAMIPKPKVESDSDLESGGSSSGDEDFEEEGRAGDGGEKKRVLQRLPYIFKASSQNLADLANGAQSGDESPNEGTGKERPPTSSRAPNVSKNQSLPRPKVTIERSQSLQKNGSTEGGGKAYRPSPLSISMDASSPRTASPRRGRLPSWVSGGETLNIMPGLAKSSPRRNQPTTPTALKPTGSLRRQKSLTRPERDPSITRRKLIQIKEEDGTVDVSLAPINYLNPDPDTSTSYKWDWWRFVSRVATFYIPSALLSQFGGMHDPNVQQAWREKVTLCTIVAFVTAFTGFLTYGFSQTTCSNVKTQQYPLTDVLKYTYTTHPHHFIVHGQLYNVTKYVPTHNKLPAFLKPEAYPFRSEFSFLTGLDVSGLFPRGEAECAAVIKETFPWKCAVNGVRTRYCHDASRSESFLKQYSKGVVTYNWDDVKSPIHPLYAAKFPNATITTSSQNKTNTLMVYRDKILDVGPYLRSNRAFLGDWAHEVILKGIGRDATRIFASSSDRRQLGDCLEALYTVGTLEFKSVGCQATDTVILLAMICILTVVLVRFILAVWFSYFLSWQLGKLKEAASEMNRERRRSMVLDQQEKSKIGKWAQMTTGLKRSNSKETMKTMASSNSSLSLGSMQSGAKLNPGQTNAADAAIIPVTVNPYETEYGEELYTIMFVTCYSEGSDGLRTTMDSLAETTFSDKYKLLVLVADGIITGAGNPKPTHELILDMLTLDPAFPSEPEPQSYVAIGDGPKKHNMARVYVAWYNYNGHCVPTLLIAKCGTPAESKSAKPGNRGKRDSQIILMSFFQKVMFDDRMSPLEYDMFLKMHYLTNQYPDKFELVLMVDADTKVAPDSLSRMVASMARDPEVMGLCGETRIANKSESWVSRIQVFEYYLSHHLNKAFESIFGGVTCLPGCFCMWRIKAPKLDQDMHINSDDMLWVPILANPDIVATYSESVVDTLHKKNLLLLGEDRFLTTLMLRAHPRRKLIFVPRAFCKTTVPAEFRVLLSQRRRWINSTIHNLLELVLVRQLCGTFCFSMQFIIALELIGTVTLPASVVFLGLLIIMSLIGPEVPIQSLLFMACLTGLPAVLILTTTRRVIYIYWMLIYLLAIPIWNFVLPVYAFWHFDDFSWGQTRKVEGEIVDKSGHGGGGGKETVDGAKEVPLRRWTAWETDRRRAFAGRRKNA
ncbi:hypothetical protein HK102_000813 [Quaeritorhiza haematococci]|nr:hypothetical protein HK102_000813 [Quaeritorhiza haematococci]